MSAKTMKNKGRESTRSEMRPEYDFSGGVRGKYYRRYIESTNVVVLEPDVHKMFRNSAAVNDSLAYVNSRGGRRAGSRPTRTRAKTARAGGR